MHWVASVVGFALVLAYVVRTVLLPDALTMLERIARSGIGAILAALSVGFTQRAVRHDPFEWFHWCILTSMVLTLAAYVGILRHRRRGGDRAREKDALMVLRRVRSDESWHRERQELESRRLRDEHERTYGVRPDDPSEPTNDDEEFTG